MINELHDLYKTMNAKNFLEYYHDALEHKEELFTLFDLGFITLEERAKGEVLFWEVCDKANNFAKMAQYQIGRVRRSEEVACRRNISAISLSFAQCRITGRLTSSSRSFRSTGSTSPDRHRYLVRHHL